MWVVSVYFTSIQNVEYIHTAKVYGYIFLFFCIFLSLYWLIIYSINRYLEKVNLIKFHTVAFYIVLILIPIYGIQIFGLGDYYLYKRFPDYTNFLNNAAVTLSGYFTLLLMYLTLNTTYLIFKNRLDNIRGTMTSFTRFIMWWGEMFIIALPMWGVYIFYLRYYGFYW